MSAPLERAAAPGPVAAGNLALAEQVANAVLYEGYILYPYRPSSVKNRQRWTFGGVYPRAYSEAQRGSDAWTMQTECLVRGDWATRLDIRVRFLHVQDRLVGELDPAGAPVAVGEPAFRPVPALRAGDRVYQTWQESVEREVLVEDVSPGDLLAGPLARAFAFPAAREHELIAAAQGAPAGVIVRRQEALAGAVEVAAAEAVPGVFKLTVTVRNLTPWADPGPQADRPDARARDSAVMGAFISTHTFLSVRAGEFISLLDPPEDCRALAAGCTNVGTWPVLIGAEGSRDLLLSSPIILYDYPQVAPESPGDLFDGAEIDEILTLRILTLTDDEKQEMRQTDQRARALLERTEALPGEDLMRLHGAMRSPRPHEETP